MSDKSNKKNKIGRSDVVKNDYLSNNTETNEVFQLEGRNVVMEALKSETPINSILVKKGTHEGTIRVIIAMAKEKDIVIKEMSKEKMDTISETGKHQGIIAICAAYDYSTIDDILEKASNKNEDPFIIILDGITDPHNLGAITRTANASGAHGIIIPKRRAVGLTSTVGKTSAGALQHVPVARVSNISNTIENLKKKGIWITCVDMDGENIYKSSLSGPIAFVIGNEGKGVSRLVKEKCDFHVSIPMFGEMSSLNASVAAAIVMYEVVRKRKY